MTGPELPPPTRPARRRLEWRERTPGAVLAARDFAARKAEGRWHVLGVLGFAGRWEKSGLAGAVLEGYITEARRALRQGMARSQEVHRDRLIVCTGATNTGVLQLTYEVGVALGVRTMSVAPDRALNYELGPLDFVIPMGESFGDESEWFVHLGDEFLLLGGGKQSHRELVMAAAQDKPITVIQGFGGLADEMTEAEWPTARFV